MYPGLLKGAALLVIAAVATATTAGVASAGDSRRAIAWEDARMLAEVMQRIRDNYVGTVDEHELMQEAARGMVAVVLGDLDEVAVEVRCASIRGVGAEVHGAAPSTRVLRGRA